MPTNTDISLVVLDWAGTTLDFGSLAPVGAFVRAFAERGVTVSVAAARGPMGLHKKDHIREMFRSDSVGESWRNATGQAWSETDVDDLYQLVTPMQIEAAAAHAELCPGVIEAVAELRRRGVRVGATTGYFRAAAEVCYTAGERQGYKPDVTVCVDDVPAGRPAPWMIFRVMEMTGIYPPDRVLKVGDTRIDILDGLNAGAWSVGVVDSSNEMGLSAAEFMALSEAERESRRQVVRETFLDAGADGVIDSLAELPELVDELNRLLATGDE